MVLGQPAGREQVLSLLAVRRLAVLLARRGYTAVRFFWRGTSDSQPLYGDPDLVGRWQDDVGTVISHVRESRGLPQVPVHAIGYRIGAALLASMSGELGTVVAWEPVGGSAFVRQWTRMRAALASSTWQRDGEADLLSLTLTRAQAENLSGLPAPSPENAAIVKEKDRRRAKAMYAVEPFDTHVHDDVLDLVMDALPEHQPVQGGLVSAPVREISWDDEHGVRLHERLVDVGPEPRVGIVTWAEGSLQSRDEAAGEDRAPQLLLQQFREEMTPAEVAFVEHRLEAGSPQRLIRQSNAARRAGRLEEAEQKLLLSAELIPAQKRVAVKARIARMPGGM